MILRRNILHGHPDQRSLFILRIGLAEYRCPNPASRATFHIFISFHAADKDTEADYSELAQFW
jgi:hypothetical protein